MSRWFRHYAGMMRDDKLVRVAIRSGQTIERVTWVWGAVLESAAEIDDGGRYDLDAAEIAYFLRADEGDVGNILNELEVSGRCSGGRVVKWSNRQFTSDRSADRQRAYRERKRQPVLPSDAREEMRNGEVTSLSRYGDAPKAELETETEVSEPNGSSPRPWSLPAGVSLQVWTDLKANRKRKRLPNTPTAWKGFNDDLARVSAQTGIPPPQLIEQCTAKGWGTIHDPKDQRNERPNDPTTSALQRVIASC